MVLWDIGYEMSKGRFTWRSRELSGFKPKNLNLRGFKGFFLHFIADFRLSLSLGNITREFSFTRWGNMLWVLGEIYLRECTRNMGTWRAPIFRELRHREVVKRQIQTLSCLAGTSFQCFLGAITFLVPKTQNICGIINMRCLN